MAQVARLGQALGDRQARPGVAAVEHVVRRFTAAREATDAVERAKGRESLESAGQQLVWVGLVPRVPHDPVARQFQQAVQGDRQLDHAERRPEVPAGLGDGPHDRLADLEGKLAQLGVGQAAQVGWVAQVGEDGHVGRWLRWVGCISSDESARKRRL